MYGFDFPPDPKIQCDQDVWGSDDEDAVVIERKDVLDFNPENTLPLSPEKLEWIHKRLAPTLFEGDGSDFQAHLTAHQPGTGKWLFATNPYKAWLASKKEGMLWIRGQSGFSRSQ